MRSDSVIEHQERRVDSRYCLAKRTSNSKAMAAMMLSYSLSLLCITFYLKLVTCHVSDSHSATSVATAAPDSYPESVVLTRSSHRAPEKDILSGFLGSEQVQDKENRSSGLVHLVGTPYIAHVTVGTKTVPLLVDTGSSDLWVAPKDFICLDSDGHPVQQPSCGFASFVNNTFSGGVVPDEYLSIIYGNGQFAYGPYGFDSVSLGGITVPDQRIALPSEGYLKVASGDFAGIFGLGYPGMVAARKGKEPKPHVNNTDPMTEYDTWFVNAVKKNFTAAMFSLALDMDGGGLLAIGGLVAVPVHGNFAVTPILMVSILFESAPDMQNKTS